MAWRLCSSRTRLPPAARPPASQLTLFSRPDTSFSAVRQYTTALTRVFITYRPTSRFRENHRVSHGKLVNIKNKKNKKLSEKRVYRFPRGRSIINVVVVFCCTAAECVQQRHSRLGGGGRGRREIGWMNNNICIIWSFALDRSATSTAECNKNKRGDIAYLVFLSNKVVRQY